MGESGALNDRIVSKVKNLDVEENIKGFILAMLGYELDHANDAGWRFTRDYEREIDRFIGKGGND